MERTLAVEALQHIGQQVTLQGWADTIRDHGKVGFVDLRDRSGIIQVVFTGEILKQLQKLVSTESVIAITGTVNERPENLINPEMETGTIEVEATTLELLNASKPLPFPLNAEGRDIGEDVRLKYRYVDLRRQRLQKNLRKRSSFIHAVRQAFLERDFVEIETPLLTKSTKEGSRDFLVPSRLQPGKFYALPQSPQQYKQLLMTAGFERYFQFARCVRDEDLRADRGFEHTQIDVEMSFVTQQEVMNTIESLVKTAVKQVGGKLQQENFPVITHKEAKEKYGADRFDLRSDKEKEDGVLAFAWVVDFPFFKKVDKNDAAEVMDGKSGWTFEHNPFCHPQESDIETFMAGENLETIRAQQYDLICNGYEVGGGSIRAHKPEILRQTFKVMGYSDQEIEESIGHMLRAFELGTPPHGGIALGLDRLIMLLSGESSLKETIAFPMSATGRTAVMDAPAIVPAEQLAELGIFSAYQDDKSLPVPEQIIQRLDRLNLTYEKYEHEPVVTSEEAAKIRNSSLDAGAKALVMNADGKQVMIVVPGSKKANLNAIKKALDVKDLSMANKNDVESKTGVEIGGVPPLGSLFGMKTYLDEQLLSLPEIFFNAGSKSISIALSPEALVKVEQPEIGNFAK